MLLIEVWVSEEVNAGVRGAQQLLSKSLVRKGVEKLIPY